MTDSEEVPTGYTYSSGEPGHTSQYLWPRVTQLVEASAKGQPRPVRIMDVGSGNGAFAAHLAALGFEVVVVEGSAYVDLAANHGTLPVVPCLEVIEHCFFPRRILKTLFGLLTPGGTLVLTTPFHGYWKNLALAATGKLDAHFTALWDYGHIKFFSAATITTLSRDAGFAPVEIERVGRIPALAKSMIVVARRPATTNPRPTNNPCYDTET